MAARHVAGSTNSLEKEKHEQHLTSPEHAGEFDNPVYKQISRINGQINTYTRDELIRNLRLLRLDTEGKNSVLAKRLKNYYKKNMLNAAGIHDHATSKQVSTVKPCFDYYIVIDFEATCEQPRTPEFRHEIIEFPAVLVNARTLCIEGEFREYCRPVINPILTEFCTSLTGITQDLVDSASLFPDVLARFEEWLSSKELGRTYSFAVVSDGPWDSGKFLKEQCVNSGIEYPAYCRYWINLRKTFSNFFKTRRVPLQVMLQILGLEFQGRAHCGLDDARNIAEILIRLLKDGAKVRFNEKLFEGTVDSDAEEENINTLYSPVSHEEFKILRKKLLSNYPKMERQTCFEK